MDTINDPRPHATPPPPLPEDAAQSLSSGSVADVPQRPFGVHLRMAWWKPPVIILATLLVMAVASVVLSVLAVIADTVLFGRDPLSVELTPLLMLATNLSLVVMAPVAILLTARLSGTPWRRLLSVGGGLRWRRLGGYLLLFAGLIAVLMGLCALVAPELLGIGRFAITGGTVGLLVVVLLTTPLQAAAEELAYRGAIMPAIGAWFRSPRPAIIAALLGSSLLFGASHLAGDPWLLAYYTLFGACLAVMVLVSQGLEAPIAFHVANNVLLMVLGALFADGGGLVIDRSAGMGGPFMLAFIAVDMLAVLLVWWRERRRAEHSTAA